MYNLKDVKEFIKHSNYIENERSQLAFEDALEAFIYLERNKRNITTKTILKTHKILMKNNRPDIAGKFRTCDVFIGGKRKIFINSSLLKLEMQGWTKKYDLKNIKKLGCNDVEEIIKLWHIEFEGIHPFEDGNGRVGRLLMNVHRLKVRLPILIIHEGKEQMEYYKWFK